MPVRSLPPIRGLLIAGAIFVAATCALACALDVVARRIGIANPSRTIVVDQPLSTSEGPMVAGVGDSLSVGYLSNDGVSFYIDPAHAYPGVAAHVIGARLVDVAIAGARCTRSSRLDGTMIPPVLSEVSRIPTRTRIVVINCGTNDILRGNSSARNFRTVVAAVRARCPEAHLVIVTLREFRRSSAAGSIEAWNAEERVVAHAYGADVVDLESEAPGVNPDWPDGIHPTRRAAEAVGLRIAHGLKARAPSIRPTVR